MKVRAIRNIALGICFLAGWTLFSKEVMFLHYNDSHGHYAGENGQKSFSQLAAWVDWARNQAATKQIPLLLTFGGDMNTGAPESDFFLAKPDIELMNLVQVNVAVLGNHEFDHPISVLKKQIRQSNFPWLSANTFLRNRESLVPAYKVFSLDGIRIGVIGLTTRSSEEIIPAKRKKMLRFSVPSKEAQKIITRLKPQTDFLVALTHLGFYPEEKFNPRKYEGEIALAKNTKGLDLILGGHSHTLVEGEIVNGVPIFQAKCYDAYLIQVIVDIVPGQPPRIVKKRAISLKEYPPKSLAPKVSRLQTKADAIIARYRAQVDKKLSIVIGHSQDKFSFERKSALPQYPLGHLIADAQRQALRADIALMNPGGIRASLPAGKITIRDILTISPFGNILGTVDMTGLELKKLLLNKYLIEKNPARMPYVSGIQVLIPTQKGSRKITILFRGKPILDHKKYRVVLNDYIAGGGSGYPDYISAKRFHASSIRDYEALRDFIRNHSPLRAKEFSKPRIIPARMD